MAEPHKDNPLLGMACAATAYLMLSTMMVFSKLLSESHSVVEVSFYRNLLAFLPLAVYVFACNRRDVTKIRSSPKLLVMRGVFGTFGMLLTFGAFSLLPLAEATVLLFSSSLFLPVLSWIFLKETVSKARWSAIAIGMIGVVIMARPTGDVNLVGIGVALAAAFMHGVLGTILRHLGKSESPLTVTFYFMLIGALLSGLPMPVVAKPLSTHDMLLAVGLGVTGLLGQVFLSAAFRYAPAALVTVFNYTGLIWATLFGWWIWNDWPSAPVFIGGGIVIAANLFILLRETYLHDRRRARERAEQEEQARQIEQEETLT